MTEQLEPWEYECYNDDCLSEIHGGDVCPNYGKCLEYTEIGVVKSGERDVVTNFDLDQSVWCIKCWNKIQHAIKADINKTLDEFE